MNDVEVTQVPVTPAEIRADLDDAELSSNPVEQRLASLSEAEQKILDRGPGSSLLDNFFDEILQFMQYGYQDPRFQIFVVSFIEKACKQDCEMLEKATAVLSSTFDDPSTSVSVRKKIINMVSQVYPLIFHWAAMNKNNQNAQTTWVAMEILKQRILQCTESDNQGICTMALKFLQTLIISQTPKTQFSEAPRNQKHIMSLDQLSRDHRFISYRKLDTEAGHDFNSLTMRMASAHIPCLNLLTCIGCVCEIARQRPDYMQKVLSSLEQLQANLPPTLSASQVKSVRKEIKMHLLRMLRHPASTQFHTLMTTLLSDVGASRSEVERSMPNGSRRTMTRPSSSNNIPQSADEPLSKRPKIAPADDDEYGDEKPASSAQVDGTYEKAIDMTANFVHERLSPKVVTNLVLISLLTLPDEMPSAFASSYTPISAAGTEGQIRHLSRIMATQFTAAGIGPGVDQMKKDQKEQFFARQQARSDGAVIPPTPFHVSAAMTPKPESSGSGTVTSSKIKGAAEFAVPQNLPAKPKGKIIFNLITAVKDLSDEEAKKLMTHAFERILNNEKRAIQGGEGVAHHVLLVRIATRFASPTISEFEKSLRHFILQDQRARTEIALLWIAELYAQYQGHSLIRHDMREPYEFTKEERLMRYDIVVTTMLSDLFEGGHHKELLFHKILLEAPLVTESMLKWLRMACMDEVFGSFGMTTLRELVLTRSRQREELLQLLFNFSYSQNQELRSQSIETAKELYMISYLKAHVRRFVSSMVELCTEATPPVSILANFYGDEAAQNALDEGRKLEWNESLIRTSLNLFLAMMPLDHSLIKKLAEVYARCSKDVKHVVLKSVEHAVKSIGMQSNDLLEMIGSCPEGAETLVMKMINLLTERSLPTPEIVSQMMKLHKNRKTDVRSLIPVLTGLSKEELLDLLPKFVLTLTYQRSVPIVFQKILTAKQLDSEELTVSGFDLLLKIHRLPTSSEKEQKLLAANIKTLLQNKLLARETIANALEALLEDKPMKQILLDSILALYQNQTSNLSGFISNVMSKIVQIKPWEEDGCEGIWDSFLRLARTLEKVSFAAVFSGFSLDQFTEYLQCDNRQDVIRKLHSYYSDLSSYQKRQVNERIVQYLQKEFEQIDD